MCMLLLLLVVFGTRACEQAVGDDAHGDVRFFVSPNGSDANTGTIEQPFATVGRAQVAARNRIRQGLTTNIVVELRGGRYRLVEPLVFDRRDSGTERYRVIYQAHQGEQPVLCGGRKITGWTRLANGSWETNVGDLRFRELFVDGQPRQRARHPNTGFFRIGAVGEDRRTGFTSEADDLDALGDLVGAELVFLHDWTCSRIPIRSFDEKSRYLKTAFPVGYSPAFGAMDNFEQHPRYAIENHAAALDAPGEWFLDSDRNLIKYIPLDGETPESVEAFVPFAEQLVKIAGPAHPEPRIRNLHFDGLTFEHCSWHPPWKGYAASQATFHEQRDENDGGMAAIPNAVVLDRVEDCAFTSCRFARLGGCGLWLRDDCRKNLIEGNHFLDISGNGLMVGASRTVERNHLSSANVVRNNLIERCGRQYFGAVAVWVGITRGTTIEHNVIRDHPYSGVSLGWKWDATATGAERNIVEDNHIYRVMQLLSDGGGIYTLGNQPGSYLRGNHIHDVPLNFGRAESNGIFMDQGSVGFTVENNLIYGIARSPLRFHLALENLVRNNTLGTAPGVATLRFNQTDAEAISKEGNRELADSAQPSQTDMEAVGEAGLEPDFCAVLAE